ncbi:transmembrane protein 39A [Cydia fagiglandana]|uniref:transmembrane protein 39A n=1 Tax=Cydia fagiglandana TaxID=1458189 RepID=UPI002FEE3FB2
MSCTENESGPFVVFFLPAVVGCLTILLARRWAYAQVNNTASTAISRRRKIIKDPLVKRPLPPITCKMTPPGPKKSSGVCKKGTSSPQEEDVNSNGKRVGRVRLSPTPATLDTKLVEGPSPPKHIPFPCIPHDPELLFEAMTFVFTVVATGLQFLNLYRTAWWLPHSYTNQSMNFYLIDPHLVAFIVTLLSRRLLLSLVVQLLKATLAPPALPHGIVAARMFILGMVIGALAWCAYFIALKYPIVKIFYLCYPAVVYFILFGLQSSPFLELSNSDSPLHCCSHDPDQVRAEVDSLRQDFNLRVKKIIFNAVVGAYYSSLIPCCFAQSYVYYDVYLASQQTACVCGALAARLAAQLLPGAYADTHHRAARHLGRWTQDDAGTANEWSPLKLYQRGAVVSLDGATYTCVTSTAAARPGSTEHSRFYTVFSNPSTLLCLLLCSQLSLIVLQLGLLYSSAPWHNFLATILLLFINYYTLFKMARDYLVSWKVYKAENMIQDKNSVVN